MDWKIELIPLAVEDVDRSVEFYGDQARLERRPRPDACTRDCGSCRSRPRGRPARSASGIGLEMMPAGSKQMIQVVIDSAEEARDYLRGRGVECSDVDEQAWGRFVTFEDPDGNRWALQQMAGRLRLGGSTPLSR